MSAQFQQAAPLLDAIETTPISDGSSSFSSDESFFSFSNPWLWLVLVIFLGVAGGGYYYYKNYYQKKSLPPPQQDE